MSAHRPGFHVRDLLSRWALTGLFVMAIVAFVALPFVEIRGREAVAVGTGTQLLRGDATVTVLDPRLAQRMADDTSGNRPVVEDLDAWRDLAGTLFAAMLVSLGFSLSSRRGMRIAAVVASAGGGGIACVFLLGRGIAGSSVPDADLGWGFVLTGGLMVAVGVGGGIVWLARGVRDVWIPSRAGVERGGE